MWPWGTEIQPCTLPGWCLQVPRGQLPRLVLALMAGGEGAAPGPGEEAADRDPGQGQGWAVPQCLLDNGPKHRHFGDILSTRKPVSGHDGFQLLVQGLLDAWVPGEVVQGPGQRVGGLGEESTEGVRGMGPVPKQLWLRCGSSTAPGSPCSGAQGNQG